MQRMLPAAVVVLAVSVAGCSRAPETETGRPDARPVQAPGGRADGGVSDTWITTKVQAQFFSDADVRGRDIDVDTRGGVVTLTGWVDTGAQRRRAEHLARQTQGVRSVQNDLKVGPVAPRRGPHTTRPGEKAVAGMGSGWITTKVRAQYFAEADLRGADIDVTTTNGVVTLLGTVPHDRAKQRAVQVARATEGVRNVDDRLRTAAETTGTSGSAGSDDAARAASDRSLGDQLDDAGITMRIQGRYFTDDEVRGRTIDVTTVNGRVRLTGEVGSDAERQQAVLVARRTPGVTIVEDLLRVNPRLAAEEQAARGDKGQPIEDGWITTKIQSKYFLDTFVNGMDLDVTTKDGVVTIAGQADSEQAKRRAVELARSTSGVQDVVDRMSVGNASTSDRVR